jgi:hypothetical protein
MAIQNLIDDSIGNQRFMNANFELNADKINHEDKIRFLRQGNLLPPTQRGVPQAVVLRLHDNSSNKKTRLYLYDAAGEEYGLLERGLDEEFEFYEDLTGIILLVDPLAFPWRQKESDEEYRTARQDSRVSPMPFENVVASLGRYVMRFLKYGRSGRKYVPLAIVINKADIPAIQSRLGDDVIQKVVEGQTQLSPCEAEHRICREALIDWGAINEIISLEHDFPCVRYFACSSLGRIPDSSGSPFMGDRVMPPLMWLLSVQK